jgi:hypothetical protein
MEGCRKLYDDITERRQAELALSGSEGASKYQPTQLRYDLGCWTRQGRHFSIRPGWSLLRSQLEQELDNGWVQSVHPDDVDYCLAKILFGV